MNATLVTSLLALLLLVPIVDAAPPTGVQVDKETDTIVQTADSSNHISERIEFRVTVTSQYNGNWSFAIQPSHQNLEAFAVRNGEEQPVNVSVVADDSGHDIAYVNLSAVHTAVSTSDTFAIRLEYDVGRTYDKIVSSGPSELVVFAQPTAGRIPNGENIPDFIDIGERYHAGVEDPAADLRYTVEFTSADASIQEGSTRDLTPYLYGLAGLVVGFLLALFLARRGLVAQKAKKFEKGGTMESRDMLEARRRTLMAALKELELAHDGKEIPDSAYAPLKEEYKAQTVRVMRRLDEKKEP